MNKISVDIKKNMFNRIIGASYITIICLFLTACIWLSDPRHHNINSDECYGFAEFLPLWANSIFAFIFVGIILGVEYFIVSELQWCFLKNKNFTLSLALFLLILLPQSYPYTLIIGNLYFNAFNHYSWELITSLYFIWIACSSVVVCFIIYRTVEHYIQYNINKWYFVLVNFIIFFAIIGLVYFSFVRSFTTIIIILLIPILCDSFAYFFGVFLGKHKMAPIISPKKTWEGAIGGATTTVIVISLLIFIYGIIGDSFNMQINFFGIQWDYKKHLLIGSVWWWVVLILIVALATIVSIYGDLLFSIFKRSNNIKDYSSSIKGHGGILDRVDSWLTVLAFFHIIFIMISIFSSIATNDNVNRIFNIGKKIYNT